MVIKQTLHGSVGVTCFIQAPLGFTIIKLGLVYVQRTASSAMYFHVRARVCVFEGGGNIFRVHIHPLEQTNDIIL